MSRARRTPPSSGSRALVLRFLGRCIAYWALALVVLSRVPWVEETGIRFTLATVAGAFAVLGQRLVRSGNTLAIGGASVSIVADCSPHVPFLIFAAVVLAFPSSWRQRVLGLAFGGLVIVAFNTLRIIALMEILVWRPRWFEFAHVYLWQTGTVLALFATFALWLRWVGPAVKPAPVVA